MLTASSATNLATAAAGGGGISGWSDFVRTLTWPQMALVMELQGTGHCLAFNYATQRIGTAVCNPGRARQGLCRRPRAAPCASAAPTAPPAR